MSSSRREGLGPGPGPFGYQKAASSEQGPMPLRGPFADDVVCVLVFIATRERCAFAQRPIEEDPDGQCRDCGMDTGKRRMCRHAAMRKLTGNAGTTQGGRFVCSIATEAGEEGDSERGTGARVGSLGTFWPGSALTGGG